MKHILNSNRTKNTCPKYLWIYSFNFRD